MHRTRRTQTLLLPRGAQIEIEYNPRRPSIRTIVRQVEALGYTVLVRPFQGRRDRKFSRFHVSTRRGSSLTYLSTPVRPPTKWGRNCKGMKWSSSHQISRGRNHRWSVQKQCGTFVRDWRQGLADRISRGDNKLAPERIRWARGSRLHIIRWVSGSKEQRPALLSDTQSKSLQFNPPKSSYKMHRAWQRMVPPWKSRIRLRVPH